jgi:hypothetical protein
MIGPIRHLVLHLMPGPSMYIVPDCVAVRGGHVGAAFYVKGKGYITEEIIVLGKRYNTYNILIE